MASMPRHRDVEPSGRSVGFGLLIPGYPHWRWKQRERAAVFCGTYLSAMAVGAFAWGSRTGMVMIAVGFAAHVASASDVIRQCAFPGFGRLVPAASASFGLGLGCYAPALALAAALAWPEGPVGSEHDRYAINRWAFLASDPRPGDRVWYRTPDGRGFGSGRLVASAGREVEWSGGSIRVDGEDLGWTPEAPDGPPQDLAMTVPSGQLLVSPIDERSGADPSCGLLLLPREDVIGRPWARLYPVWTRRLLY